MYNCFHTPAFKFLKLSKSGNIFSFHRKNREQTPKKAHCQLPEPVVGEHVAVRNHDHRAVPSSVLFPCQVPGLCPLLIAYLVVQT